MASQRENYRKMNEENRETPTPEFRPITACDTDLAATSIQGTLCVWCLVFYSDSDGVVAMVCGRILRSTKTPRYGGSTLSDFVNPRILGSTLQFERVVVTALLAARMNL